jgi:hypothetical protein
MVLSLSLLTVSFKSAYLRAFGIGALGCLALLAGVLLAQNAPYTLEALYVSLAWTGIALCASAIVSLGLTVRRPLAKLVARHGWPTIAVASGLVVTALLFCTEFVVRPILIDISADTPFASLEIPTGNEFMDSSMAGLEFYRAAKLKVYAPKYMHPGDSAQVAVQLLFAGGLQLRNRTWTCEATSPGTLTIVPVEAARSVPTCTYVIAAKDEGITLIVLSLISDQ